MACFKPLLAIPYPSSHAKYGQYLVLGSALDPLTVNRIPNWPGVDKSTGVDVRTGQYLGTIRIPCGKCLGCRLDKSRDWATRIVCESMDYPESANWFVTLTYADYHIERDGRAYYPHATQNEDGALILDKSHPQLWLKSIREGYDRRFGARLYDTPVYYDESLDKEIPLGTRYYLAGEYGDQGQRPHYHCILMNTPLPDIYPYGKTRLGMPLFRSPYLEEKWGRGFVTIGQLNYRTAAYTARYTMKKADGKTDAQYEALGLTPEYTVMSRRPGIGYNYLVKDDGAKGRALYIGDDDHAPTDSIILPAIDERSSNINKPPRYFDVKYSEIDPVAVAKAKSRRAKVAEKINAIKLEDTDLDEAAYMEVLEKSVTQSVKTLARKFTDIS